MPSFAFRSLTTRLIFWILPLVGCLTGLILALSSRVSRQSAVHAAEREAGRATVAAVNQALGVLSSIEEGTRVLAEALASVSVSDPELEGLLRRFVLGNTHIYGSATAFEPRAFDPSLERFSPYVHRAAGVGSSQLVRADLAAQTYRYWERDWYVRPVRSRQPAWSEPYFDEGGGNVLMVTYSVPVMSSAGGGAELRGVVTADVHLEWLARLAREFRIGRTGFAVLFSREGRVIGQPDASQAAATLVDELARAVRGRVASDVQGTPASPRTLEPLTLAGAAYRLARAPVGATGWSLAAVYPEDELMEGVRRLVVVEMVVGGAGLLALAAVVVVLSRRLTAPIRELAGKADELAAGNLDLSVPESLSRDEIGALTRAFRKMRDALKARIRELQEATAARERMESELRIARRIQMGLLPEGEAGGPGAGYALAARLGPARAVGGDLYDHFLQDGRLYFLAADVSGKGIGAALFMARAKTLFETVASAERDPAGILKRINRGLLRENEEGMYVTGVCGVLDVDSGELALALAGHDPPFLAGGGRAPAQLKVEGGPVLGLIDAAVFPTNHLRLNPGEEIVVYTDGVPDALDMREEFFSTERLSQAIALAAPGGAHALTVAVFESVRIFVGVAPQADDITVLTVQYMPPSEAKADRPE
jgi:sigma-B regulation protein RsbU (phosphoserine phosphatase)